MACVNQSDIVYDYVGKPSIVGTLIVCIRNVQDILLYPGYWTLQPLNVSSQVSLNNLDQIEELTSSATLDIFFSLVWVDPRLSMPALWAQVDPEVYSHGVDITQATQIQGVQGVQPLIWLPDIIFPEASSIDVTDYYIKLYPNGTVKWYRHFILTLSESSFVYKNYPDDTQTILIRYYSYSMSTDQLVLVPAPSTAGGSLIFMQSADSDALAFSQSPTWTLGSSSVSFSIMQSNPYVAKRWSGLVEVDVTRRQSGIVVRLALPMFLLVFLAALAFWADPTDRMNTTITVLLAVSALYIVVFSNIPMIGYLTDFDVYVISMFAILFGCCAVHQLIVRLRKAERVSKWPMRGFYIQFLEMCGRLIMIPLITAMYIAYFYTMQTRIDIGMAVLFVVLFSIFVAAREIASTRKSFGNAMAEISSKFEHLDDLSTFELIIVNAYFYGIFSWSLSRHMREMKKKHEEHKKNLPEQRVSYTSSIIENKLRESTDGMIVVASENSAHMELTKFRSGSNGASVSDAAERGRGQSHGEGAVERGRGQSHGEGGSSGSPRPTFGGNNPLLNPQRAPSM